MPQTYLHSDYHQYTHSMSSPPIRSYDQSSYNPQSYSQQSYDQQPYDQQSYGQQPYDQRFDGRQSYDDQSLQSYDDDYQNASSTFLPVVDSSPVCSPSFNDCGDTSVRASNPATYSTFADPTITSHMVSSPNSTNQIPQQDTPQYGARNDQNWAYSRANIQHPQPVDERRVSVASVAGSNTEWTHSHDKANYYGADRFDVSSEAQSPNESSDHYSQVQGRYTFPGHVNHRAHQRSFGIYSPRQHLLHQQLAETAPREMYPENWTTGVGPEGAFECQYSIYGVLPISYESQHEVPASAGHECGYSSDYVNQQFAHHTHRSELAAPTPPQSGPDTITFPQQAGTPAPQPSNKTDPRAPNPQSDFFAQQHQTTGYQRQLEQQHEPKRMRFVAQLEETEASHLQGDYAHTAMQNNPQHYSSHHRQNSTGSFSGHSNLPMPIPPVVPSQAHERSSPVGAATGPELAEKKGQSKKPALACLFCRKRKIACGPPPPGQLDRTCNQCLRRKQDCTYPTESRRGIRKKKLREPASESPTAHKFVGEDLSLQDTPGPSKRGRRKRSNSEV